MARKFLKISLLCFFCATFFAAKIFPQHASFRKINAYAKEVDRLKSAKRLTKYFYPNKSCGGALDGWFLNDELVYLEAFDGDYDQKTLYFVYVKNEKILKVVTKFYERGKNGKMTFKETENSYPKSYNPFDCGDEMIADLKREKTLASDRK